jgi:hypothetical protein
MGLVEQNGYRYRLQGTLSVNETIKNQLGKPTATPTMRWVFQCFQQDTKGYFSRKS